MVPLASIGQVYINTDGDRGNLFKPHIPFLSFGHFPQTRSFLVPMIFHLFGFGDKNIST